MGRNIKHGLPFPLGVAAPNRWIEPGIALRRCGQPGCRGHPNGIGPGSGSIHHHFLGIRAHQIGAEYELVVQIHLDHPKIRGKQCAAGPGGARQTAVNVVDFLLSGVKRGAQQLRNVYNPLVADQVQISVPVAHHHPVGDGVVGESGDVHVRQALYLGQWFDVLLVGVVAKKAASGGHVHPRTRLRHVCGKSVGQVGPPLAHWLDLCLNRGGDEEKAQEGEERGFAEHR